MKKLSAIMKNCAGPARRTRLLVLTLTFLMLCLVLQRQNASAHSVAQLQTTKFFAPETVQMLIDRAVAGHPGFLVGDTVNYIIQFTPVENSVNAPTGQSNYGANGYVTDYIPLETEVVGAWIVTKDGSGNFNLSPPSLPGGMDDGWGIMATYGDTEQQFYNAPFNVNTYDPTGRCAALNPTPTTVTLTASGNWTAPANVTSATVQAWGGGGAGGGVTTDSGGTAYKGGGGAGGQFASSTLTVVPGNTYAVVVGAGGTGSNGNGTAGGDSTFAATSVVAKGGAGGLSYENLGTAGTGTTTSGVGTTVYAGGNGSNGGATATGGAGGGGAGTGGAGGNAAGNTAGTGRATGGGNGAGGLAAVGNGTAGAVYGGGGSGGYTTSATDRTGGAGAAGRVVITYSLPLYTNNCNSRLTNHVADTGIFYSTDSRTAQFPPLPTRALQGTNGYLVNPTGAGQLNPIIGQAQATTHNLWDADQTNAFGTATLPGAGGSTQPILITNTCGNNGTYTPCPGYGSPPYFAGSPVAGPQTGYWLDNTGFTGPWNRIAYPGSRIGDPSNGPATTNGNSTTAVNGSYTSVGWNLSESNPLPLGTTAVRWAVGRLTVGELRYVKIALRLTAPVPAGGLVNSSEVFGGDTSDSDDGAHNTWRYMVPSVADNNSNLYVLKTIVGYCAPGTLACAINSNSGSVIPATAKVRYRIVYLNTGNATQTNVVLTDTLPCQTAAAPVSYLGTANTVTIISGPITAPAAATLSAITAGTNGVNCTAAGRRTFSFPPLASLGPGEGGVIEFDVLTNAAADSVVPNTATISSTQLTPGVTSIANTFVQSIANLSITKTTSTPAVVSGGTATYTIVIKNTGTIAATNINIYDMLPTTGGAADATTRFNFNAGSSIITGMTAVVPTTNQPPTLTPYNATTNQQQVRWNFGAQTLASGASFTITFSAAAGANVPASATPYYNTAAAMYTYTGSVGTPRIDTLNVAGVRVTSALSVSKSIDCFYSGPTCIAYAGSIPANAKVRYRIGYSNSGSTVSNVVLTDTLPCQAGANPVSAITVVSGPIPVPATNPPVVAAGNCGTGTRQPFSFPSTTLSTGQTGTITIEVQTNATTTMGTVYNNVTLSGTGATTAAAEVQTTVQTAPFLTLNKTTSATGAKPGQTVPYTITVTNTGTADATGITLYDWLPTSAPTNSLATRLTFSVGSSSFTGSITGVVPTVTIPPTKPPYNNIPAGTNPNAANMEEVMWDFGSQTLATGATFTLTFNAVIGAAVPAGTYYNNSRAYYNTTQQSSSQAAATNVSSLVADVSVTKTNSSTLIPAGGSTTYTIVVTNNGPDAANNTVIVDPVATGLTKTGPITCVVTAGTASCPDLASRATPSALEHAGLVIPLLPSGGQITLTTTATVTTASGWVSNVVTVTTPTTITDGNWANNTATDGPDLVLNSPQLMVMKSAWVYSDLQNGTTNPKAVPGAIMTYEIRITNSGGGTADSAAITDNIAAEIAAGRLAFNTQFADATKSCAAGEGNVLSTDGGASWACQSGNWNSGTGTLTVPGLSIAPGADVRVKFQVTVQ